MAYKTLNDIITTDSRAILINGVPIVDKVTKFFLEFLENNDELSICIKAEDFRKSHNIKMKIVGQLEKHEYLKEETKKINGISSDASIEEIFEKLDNNEEQLYIVVQMPSIKSLENNKKFIDTIDLQEKPNNQKHKEAMLFDKIKLEIVDVCHAALSIIRNEYENIKFIFGKLCHFFIAIFIFYNFF